jgi:hypothetical protein
MLISLRVLEFCSGQSSKWKIEQRVITQKSGRAELRFLYTAHLPNEIYQATKFHVDTSCCLGGMSRTRKADRGTKRQLFAHPSGA